MNIKKLESDISILEDQILKVNYEIELVETQLQTKELTTDGSDEYFDWRRRALIAISHKRTLKNSMSRQLRYWKGIHRVEVKKNNLKLSKEILKENAKKKEKARLQHIELLETHKKLKEVREKEKTERHRISEEKNVLITKEFKKLVKELIGKEKYIELIQKAEQRLLGE